ncbi:MAG: hypothetical protein OJF50_005200 [Nitrospira sp.]|nr:hypothetical protein [Nitrospira sp.]
MKPSPASGRSDNERHAESFAAWVDGSRKPRDRYARLDDDGIPP